MAALSKAATGNDADAIQNEIKNIDKETQEFAARRMDRDLCPDGAVLEAKEGEIILDVALRNGIDIEHACDKSCACTTCHCIVREGFDSLTESTEDEDDMLDKAWGLEPESRLGCQIRMGDEDLVVEIPRYTLNHAREH
ncbi:unnamed protein product [Ranitomeya imitator]|uniref:2Fe-2S ferredoxin n=1 Tax=Ranitomeya imitator TaxID=111125 RepID=A0ABN9LLZ2_9NEOB|nr:unnamed protein product [Ranitomeya imitator]